MPTCNFVNRVELEWKPGHLFGAFGSLLLNGVTTRRVASLTRFASLFLCNGRIYALCIVSSPSPTMSVPAIVCLIMHACFICGFLQDADVCKPLGVGYLVSPAPSEAGY